MRTDADPVYVMLAELRRETGRLIVAVSSGFLALAIGLMNGEALLPSASLVIKVAWSLFALAILGVLFALWLEQADKMKQRGARISRCFAPKQPAGWLVWVGGLTIVAFIGGIGLSCAYLWLAID